MQPIPERSFLIPTTPKDIPGLVCFWNFNSPGSEFTAEQGEPYTLRSGTGPLEVVDDPEASFGGKALRLKEGEWLSVPRGECPRLDIHGQHGNLTLMAWIKREKTARPQCEFIAGQWNETNLGRQYGLFLNIIVWGESDRVFGHISGTGGPTPGYKYCMDGSTGATPVAHGEWSVTGMSYDGKAGYSWHNGLLDANGHLNPYPLAGGLHNGGPKGSDFTVGAVHRSGEMGNFFCGSLAALAVYDRSLTAAEIYALAHCGK
ncbi:MAG: LamG domain-containing protein [Planctomycetes bacterium]|nr:LamG domain-containing protein [Planctomycetota bacterium]